MPQFDHKALIADKATLKKVGPFQFQQLTVERQTFAGDMQELSFKPVVFERGDAAAALLYDMDRQVVVFTYQFRAPAFVRSSICNGWIYELMAGMMEFGEDGEATVKREAIEELGYQILETEHIYNFFVSPGGTTEVIHLYAAQVSGKDIITDGGGVVAEGEDIRRIELSFDEVFDMLDSGKIVDAKTIIALMWLRQKLNSSEEDSKPEEKIEMQIPVNVNKKRTTTQIALALVQDTDFQVAIANACSRAYEGGKWHTDFDLDDHLNVARNLAGAQAVNSAAHTICYLRGLDPQIFFYEVMCQLSRPEELSEAERNIVLSIANATWSAQQPLIYDKVKAPELNDDQIAKVDAILAEIDDPDIAKALALRLAERESLTINAGYHRVQRMNVFAELDPDEVAKDFDQIKAAAATFCNAMGNALHEEAE